MIGSALDLEVRVWGLVSALGSLSRLGAHLRVESGRGALLFRGLLWYSINMLRNPKELYNEGW